MIYRIEETTSTNDDARDAKYRHGDIVWAERQTAGRGQRGHKWSSAEGLNLTFSLVLEPRFLPAGEQFLLNEAVALALTDTFAQFGIAARIKWTNDIYAGDKKLVGILIEHSYSGQTLARTIVGIGINVNQTEFDPALPNPVSMAMVAGRTFDRGEVLEAFRRHIGIRYAQLELDERETLQRDYRERMYRLGERHTFRYPDGTPTEASIEGVRPTGELLLRHADGTLREYLFKEIEFVIAGKYPVRGPAAGRRRARKAASRPLSIQRRLRSATEHTGGAYPIPEEGPPFPRRDSGPQAAGRRNRLRHTIPRDTSDFQSRLPATPQNPDRPENRCRPRPSVRPSSCASGKRRAPRSCRKTGRQGPRAPYPRLRQRR